MPVKCPHRFDFFNPWSQLVVLFGDSVEPLKGGDLEEKRGHMKRVRALGFYNWSVRVKQWQQSMSFSLDGLSPFELCT